MPKPYMTGDFPYRSIEDLRRAHDRNGGYFFEPSTMRFFRSRILDGVYGGRYFVTSEQREGAPRLYTVREALPSGRIEHASEFQEFGSAAEARRYAEKILPGHSVYLANLVVWANKHAEGDWRRAAEYAGLTHKGDRLELRRMFRSYAEWRAVSP